MIDDSELLAIEARAKAAEETRAAHVGMPVADFDPGPWVIEVPKGDVLRLVAEVRRLRAGLASLRETMRQMVEDLGGDDA